MTTDLTDSITNREIGSALKGATVDIKVKGIVAISRIEQTFVNDTDDVIEAVYQFPLPSEAVLMAITIVINDQVHRGQVAEKQTATGDYEKGIADGKRSVLVETMADGLYQISAGNLDCGDNVTVKLEVASLIQHQGEKWLFRLPTVIGEKYGSSEFEFLQEPKASLFANYQLQGSISLEQANQVAANLPLNKQSEECWSFAGKLDRDLIFTWASDLQPNQLFCAKSDIDQQYYYAGLLEVPTMDRKTKNAANLQLLIDCSGSMAGLSIAQARMGLTEALSRLGVCDRANLIRFGSHHTAMYKTSVQLDEHHLNCLLQEAGNLEASYGGTEIFSALQTAINCAQRSGGGDILLLTDGQVWQKESLLESIVTQAKALNIRIFTVGVGSAVSEDFIRALSNLTGGNSLILDQNSGMAFQIETLIQQLRSPRYKVELAANPKLSMLPQAVFESATIPTYMIDTQNHQDLEVTFKSEGSSYSQRLLHQTYIEQPFAEALCRLVVKQALPTMDVEHATQAAVNFGIITENTSYVMVDENVVDGADGIPKLQEVPQMVPHGRVMLSLPTDFVLMNECVPQKQVRETQYQRHQAQAVFFDELVEFDESYELDDLALPEFSRKQSDDEQLESMGYDRSSSNFDAKRLLIVANQELDRRSPHVKPVSIEWLSKAGLPSELCEQMHQFHNISEPCRVYTLLLYLDLKYSLLTVRVLSLCESQAVDLSENIEFDKFLRDSLG